MTFLQTLKTWAINWALGVIGCFVLLWLMAWMDSKQSETAAMRITAQVVNDRAAEHAALKGAR